MIRVNLLNLFFDPQQVLCKVSDARSDFVTDSPNYLSLHGFAVSHTATVPKNPLRAIVSRTPFFADFYRDGTTKLAWFVDTLDCGHQQVVYPFDVETGKKRHRCAECAAASQKKPNQSVTASLPKKEAA